MKHLVPLITVAVRRDITTTLSIAVPAHEIPVLHAIHGRDNVFPGEEGDVTAIDPDTEFDRLGRKYGQEAVDTAYGATGYGEIPRQVEAASVGTVDDDETGIKLEGPDSKPASKAPAAKGKRKPAAVE